MKNIYRYLVKMFFNKWYKFFPPPMVQYWKSSDTARAKVVHGEDNSLNMVIEGEKEMYPGFPRGHILMGSLSKVKHKIRTVFNDTYNEIDGIMKEAGYDLMPPEKMTPAVRELWRAFEELENAEVTEDMKARIRLYKKVICYLFQEDDAYRFRFQWISEAINWKKVKLSKQDKYYFRGKYFKVDNKKFDY